MNVSLFADRGVVIPCPEAVEIDDSIPLENIAPGAVIHSGSRIRGARTTIGPGSVIGAEAPATVAEPTPVPPPRHHSTPKSSGIGKAIEEVTEIIEELKHVLDEMEGVLETLEVAERQKTDDERDIESLQRALRQLRRPASGGHHAA